MQHFKPVISNDASLSGSLVPIVVSHRLAGSKCGRSSLPVTSYSEKFEKVVLNRFASSRPMSRLYF